MSKYEPAAIVSDDSEIANAPSFGGEWAVFLSHTPAKRIGDITMTASGTGVWTPNAAVAISAAGADLQIVSTAFLRSPAVACTLTLAVTNDASSATSASASFTPPARAANQTFHFPYGTAKDLTLLAGSKIKAISGVTITGGSANNKFSVYELPASTDYYLVGCTTDKNFTLKDRTTKGVDCGMITDAFVKRGKTKPAMLTISQKLTNFADGLARAAGGRVVAKLVSIKDGQVTDTVIAFVDWIPTNDTKLPDGDGEAMMEGTDGKYGEALIFTAP